MFKKIILEPFIKRHPPRWGNLKPSKQTIQTYEGRLPKPLLELWKKHGFGFYGKTKFRLIDPSLWQETLDRWIISPPDEVKRIPIALCPFGEIIYYRKLTEDDEDLATIDPVERGTQLLSYDLVDFFNELMLDPEYVDDIFRAGQLETAKNEKGRLKANEVYYLDPILLNMEMLKIDKRDALELHKELRDAVDEQTDEREHEDTDLIAMMPKEYRLLFSKIADEAEGLNGIFLSAYLGWQRLLGLTKEGKYHLLFWRNKTEHQAPSEIRYYTGEYKTRKNNFGDETLHFTVILNDDSLGSDANDEDLLISKLDDEIVLFQTCELDYIMDGINAHKKLDDSNAYFKVGNLHAPIPDDYENPIELSPSRIEVLPQIMQAELKKAPIEATIIAVDDNSTNQEECTIMVTLDQGSNDGLKMNTPLFSQSNAKHKINGWVWELSPTQCHAGIEVSFDSDGKILNTPKIGDVFTNKKA